ncbi:ATP-binding protein [Halomonas organivorans]|uniref:histidine kinase n=1 Tax=Halomonas organivorans TaxID=257772 RepID=A0A7W5G5C9_9GAMM|nr:ATP-binding protein [Halomonas organivorans]MBB3140301.1 signal transduction histidine kinase [Halomonas organivorans]
MHLLDRRSLRGRLLVWLGGAAFLVMAMTWLLHGILLRDLARDFLGDRLRQEAAYTIERLRQEPTDRPPLTAPTSLAARVFHHLYVLRFDGEVTTSHPAWLEVLHPFLESVDASLIDVHRQGSHLLVYRRAFSFDGHEGVLLVGESFDRVEAGLSRLHWWIGVIAGLVLLLLIGLNLLAVRAGLGPIAQLQRQLEELRQGTRARLQLTVPAELEALVSQLNRFMDAQENRLKRSRHAVSDLSHALKTPLAAIMQVMRGQRPIDPPRRAKILARLEDMQAQLNAELRRSRIAGADSGQHTCPERELSTLLDMFRTLYPDKTFLSLGMPKADARLAMERQDFMEMAGIVLDNAGKWARHTIRIHATVSDGLCLMVEDDGPGVPTEQLTRLGQRGRRLDEGRPGHGLGLSILIQLLEHYRGNIEFQAPPDSGLRVTIHIPAA